MRSQRRTHGGALLIGASVVGALMVASLGAFGTPAGAVTNSSGTSTGTSTGTPPPNAFIVVDAATGAVLSGRNMHEALPAASVAKIMTALVAVERLPPDALISVSPNAAAREAMRIGMKPGSRWPFDQAMASLMMISANDAAYAIAETVAGSVAGFAADLHATARRYGVRDSAFGDPAGLSDTTSYDGGPNASAYDLAIAARNALQVHEIAKFADTRTYQFTDASGVQHSLTNHNKFLPDNGFGYPGANGFKTGYTEAADHTLVATALRNGRQCIAVILGSVDSGYTWAASLLDQCFSTKTIPASDTRLPPVAVSPYAKRAAEQRAFQHLVPGGTRLASSTATSSASASASAAGKSPARAAGIATALAAAKQKASHKHSGLLTTTRAFILLLLALAVVFVLRRRAVKRQRARRIARQRARRKAMRSGSLPVVDGRYRTGARLGPPVESQVQVERGRRGQRTEAGAREGIDLDLTVEERRRSSGRGPT